MVILVVGRRRSRLQSAQIILFRRTTILLQESVSHGLQIVVDLGLPDAPDFAHQPTRNLKRRGEDEADAWYRPENDRVTIRVGAEEITQ